MLDMRMWGWPIAMGLLTILGLLAALIGETGFWLWLSWIAFSAPIAVIIRYSAPAFFRRVPGSAEGATHDPDA